MNPFLPTETKAVEVLPEAAGMSTSYGLCRAILICALIMPAGVLAIAEPPQPGMLNSFTGEVRMNGVPVVPKDAGRTTLEIGRTIKVKVC